MGFSQDPQMLISNKEAPMLPMLMGSQFHNMLYTLLTLTSCRENGANILSLALKNILLKIEWHS